MDTIPDNTSMDKQPPLAGLNPADLLRQGMEEDTLADEACHGFTPSPPAELAPLFPQFEILELIGQGGMGAVYKVRQKDLDRIVALKILPPAISRTPEFSSRFTREARALAKLNHPGIVTLHEFGQQDGLYFILMEFVDGVNLAQLMKTGRVSPREALAIVPQICDALQYAHDQGVVHRDIKPGNILLDRAGRVKVADFGIAKVVAAACDRRAEAEERPSQDAVTVAGKIIGTPQYMAPEQIENPSEVDHRADIYALGVVFYQMLTGELPGTELQAPSRKVHIDVRLDEIVLKALEKQPEQRYQQASIFKTRVETITETSPAGHRGQIAGTGGEQTVEGGLASSATNLDGRFSRTALWGAVCLVLALAGFLADFDRVPGGGLFSDFNPVYGILFAAAGSVLGWISIAQIRKSKGKLCGMGLAVFDACLFPLLLVSGIMLRLLRRLFIVELNEGHFFVVLLVLIFAILSAVFLIRFRRAVEPPDGGGWNGTLLLGLAGGLAVILGMLGLAFNVKSSVRPLLSSATLSSAADDPFRLQSMPKEGVIEAALAKPLSPWAWQELERRALTVDDAVRIMDGLDTWLRREHPAGISEPLHRLHQFLEHLDERGLLTDEQMIRFLVGTNGSLRPLEPAIRLRQGERSINITATCRHIWSGDLWGLRLLTEIRGVSLYGRSLPVIGNFGKSRDTDYICGGLELPDLAPGSHELRLEVLSALVPLDDLAGMFPDAPSGDWPPAWKRWTRDAVIRIHVFPPESQLVGLTQEPALDPVRSGGLGIKQVIIRRKWNKAQAVLEFDLSDKLPVPVSFDVLLRLGKTTRSCGVLWAKKRPDGKLGSYGNLQFSVALEPPGPDISEAEILLTPNLRAVERDAAVDRVWGGEVKFSHVPLRRLDVPDNHATPQDETSPKAHGRKPQIHQETLSFGPVIERVMNDDGAKGDFLIDLDTGNPIGVPPGLNSGEREAFAAWLRDRGVDAMCETSVSVRGLVGIDMIVRPLAGPLWQSLTPQAAVEDDVLKRGAPGSPVFLTAKGELPETWLFRTREGGVGLLQITGFTENPRGLRIRYKLVQDVGTYLPQISRDQILVEDLAHRMIMAIREKDDAKLREFASKQIADWPDALPRYATKLRELYRRFTGNDAFDLRPGKALVEDELAVVRSDGPAELNGKCLAMYFVKTDEGWRCHSLRAITEEVPTPVLMEYLKNQTRGSGRVVAPPWEREEAEEAGKSNAAVRSLAEAWLAKVDAGEYERSWKDAADFFRSAMTEAAWSAALAQSRAPLGLLVSRKLQSEQAAESLPGAPDGKYVVMQFEASFAAKKSAIETVTFMLEKDGNWRAAGYFIR